MPTLPDDVLPFFTLGRRRRTTAPNVGVLENRLICKGQPPCKKHYALKSGTSTLRYHLEAKHSSTYVRKPKGDHEQPKGSVQTTLTGSGTSISKARHEAATKAILECVVENYLPFSFVDSDSFKRLIQIVNPIFKPACAATVRSALNPHRLVLEQKMEIMLNDSCEFVSMTCDDWTSNNRRPFLGITLHWINKDFQLQDCPVELVPHPYPHDAESIKELVRKYSIDRPFHHVPDCMDRRL